MCLIHENPQPLLVLRIYVDGTQRVLVLLVLAILFQDCKDTLIVVMEGVI